MRTLSIFNHVTLDGYFTGNNGEFNWAHQGADDPEFASFVSNNAKGDSQLLFGRKTYELMAGYWPSPMAKRDNPTVAEGMNTCAKVVFSKTLQQASWNNTELIKVDLLDTVREMKKKDGPVMVMMGSGSVIAQLAAAGLIDEYQLMVNPIALGAGRTMFQGLTQPLNLRLKSSRQFKNGKSYLCFEPQR
jgi:dihydrofolate reductase